MTTSEDQTLLDLCNKKDATAEEARRLLEAGASANAISEKGMSPLMNACMKGNVPVSKVLLEFGANVNYYEKENHYTPLMFAAMSGSLECTDLVLNAGANKYASNKMSKSAGGLAAFVGQHHTAARINSFITAKELEPFLKPYAFEEEPRITEEELPRLHKWMLFNEFAPAPLAGYLRKHPSLIATPKAKLLLSLSEEYLSRGHDGVALKLHYLACIIQRSLAQEGGVDALIKFLWKKHKSDGFRYGEEAFVRQSIRTFKFDGCDIFKKVVRTIAPIKPGQTPTAVEILSGSINGPMYRPPEKEGSEGDKPASAKGTGGKVDEAATAVGAAGDVPAAAGAAAAQ